jgi:hypothetical protein
MIFYCAHNLTDGVIHRNMIAKIAIFEDILDWESALALLMTTIPNFDHPAVLALSDGFYEIHDYLEYQPSRAKVIKERAEAKERMQRARSANNHELQPNNHELRANIERTSDDVRTEQTEKFADCSPNVRTEQTEKFADCSPNVRQMFAPCSAPPVPVSVSDPKKSASASAVHAREPDEDRRKPQDEEAVKVHFRSLAAIGPNWKYFAIKTPEEMGAGFWRYFEERDWTTGRDRVPVGDWRALAVRYMQHDMTPPKRGPAAMTVDERKAALGVT